jgi:hypothetical protein
MTQDHHCGWKVAKTGAATVLESVQGTTTARRNRTEPSARSDQ